MKEKYFRLFEYKNGLEIEVTKVYNLHSLFSCGYLDYHDLGNIIDEEKSFVNDEDCHAIQRNKYRYTLCHTYIVADEKGVSVALETLETVYDNFIAQFSDLDVDGLFNVPDVVRGAPIEGTGKTCFFKKLKAIKCLNEIKQTCARHLDEFEPDVRPIRKHHNIGCWEDAYYFRGHQSKNWKNYRKKQYK